MNKKIYIILLNFVVSINIMNAQEEISSKKLKEDFDILMTASCELSPTFNKKEKEESYAFLRKIKSKLDGKTMSAITFFKFLLNQRQEKGKNTLDEHANIALTNEEMMKLIGTKNSIFPIPISVINGKLVVNSEDVEIPFGSIITKINDKPTSDIIGEMISDDESTFLKRNIEKSFDVLYLIKYNSHKWFNFEYQLPNSNETKHIKIKAINIKKRQKLHAKKVFPLQGKKINNIVNAKYLKDLETYYFQLNSFSENKKIKNVDDFYRLFKSIFKNIKELKAKNLIVDLRYNPGGNMMIPSMLYYFLSQKPYKEEIKVIVPDFDIPNKKNLTKIDHQKVDGKQKEELINKFKSIFTKKENHYESVLGVDGGTLDKNPLAFKGKVYLIVGGGTFSAASYFTAIFKSQNRGVIVGENVGGQHKNITAAKQFTYTLPNTKIELTMPIGILKFSKEIEQCSPYKNIHPDVVISEDERYNYFLSKQDWEIEKILEIIEEKDKN